MKKHIVLAAAMLSASVLFGCSDQPVPRPPEPSTECPETGPEESETQPAESESQEESETQPAEPETQPAEPETQEESETQPEESESQEEPDSGQLSIVDNPDLAPVSFATLQQDGNLVWHRRSVTVDDSISEGILIQGTCKDLSKTRFQISEDYDFGTATIQRVQVYGLGVKDRTTIIHFYLDHENEPFANITLDSQDEEDNWDQELQNMNAIVDGQNITGKHKISFTVEQYSEDGTADSDDECSVLLDSVQFVAATVPLVNIRIDESKGTIEAMNSDETHNTLCYGDMDILLSDDYDGDYTDSFTGGTYEMKYIKGRGNSTWTPGLRLPYKIKLSEATDLFGMGENANWALIANAYDPDLIRNAFTYKIGENLGMEFTPNTVSVDVVMNGRYLGNYLLCETVSVGASRVDIDDLEDEENAENITGGYLIGAGSEGADEDAHVFSTSHGIYFAVNSPAASDDPNYQAEVEYIENYMQRIENALYGEPNPETGVVEDPFDLMDLDSAVRYYWIQELSANVDFCRTGSTYCYKVRDGKLYWGPLWDFDVAWADYNMTADQWQSQICWFQLMLSNDEFCEAASTYYTETLKPLLDEMLAENGYCNTYFAYTEYSALNNYEVWGYGNSPYDKSDYVYDRSEIRTLYENSHLKFTENVTHRVSWCSENLDSLKTTPVNVVFMAGDEVYKEVTGYAGSSVSPFPENPQIEGKRFLGWYYDGFDWEGNPCEESFSPYSQISKESITDIDGQPTFIIYAKLEDRDESLIITQLEFEQSTCEVEFDPNGGYQFTEVQFSIDPEGGYADEIVWSIDDASIVEYAITDTTLSLHPLKEGTAVITAMLTDGTTSSITVNVKLKE